MTMSDEDLPTSAPINSGDDGGSTSSAPAAETSDNPAKSPSPCPMTAAETGGVDSDSGGSLSSSASPAPPLSTATHDEWNVNEPSDGADSGVGANGSTPVDGESLCLSFDGATSTGSPAYMLSPPFVPPQYTAVPPTVHPSCVSVASVVGSDGLQPAPLVHSPVVSHPLGTEDHLEGGTTTATNVMTSAAGAAPSQQYVVNVHVNAGETFSVRAGDRVQLIHGDATSYLIISFLNIY